MKSAPALIFLFFMPFMASAAHDAYLSYTDGIVPIKMADLGYIWTTYHLASFEYASGLLSPDMWDMINAILQTKASFATLGLGIALTVVIIGSLLLKEVLFGVPETSRKRPKKFTRFNRD